MLTPFQSLICDKCEFSDSEKRTIELYFATEKIYKAKNKDEKKTRWQKYLTFWRQTQKENDRGNKLSEGDQTRGKEN